MRGLSSSPEGIDLRDNLARALSGPWGRPIDLARFAVDLIRSSMALPAYAFTGRISDCEAARRATWGDNRRRSELLEICRDRLLLCLLESTIVFDVELERYLATVRRLCCRGGERRDQYAANPIRHLTPLSVPWHSSVLATSTSFACTIAGKGAGGAYCGDAADRMRCESGNSFPTLWLAAVAGLSSPSPLLRRRICLCERRWPRCRGSARWRSPTCGKG